MEYFSGHYRLGNEQQSPVIFVRELALLANALTPLGLPIPRPTLVLVGGASKIETVQFERLRQLFEQGIAPLAEQLGAIVVDGGTDAGIMRLMGQARTAIAGTFPLIGVAAIDTFILPDRLPSNPDAALPAPAHTHFILVPGNQWGDESPWLASLPDLLAAGMSSLTLVVNGGEITWQDVEYSVRHQRPTFVLGGSGRTADRLAATLGDRESDPRAIPLVESGYLHLLFLDEPFSAICGRLKQALSEVAPSSPPQK